MNKTHWKKVVSDPNFLGEADFQDGEEKVGTIARINQDETIVTTDGKSKKAVIHFKEPGLKPMILNVARSKSIVKVAGSPYFEDWIGVRIVLFVQTGIKAFGDVVNAVRVRPYAPKEEEKLPPCADCCGEIKAAMGKSAQFMAAYTAKKYGVSLCAGCATKRNQADSPAETSNDDAASNPPEEVGHAESD